MKPTLEVLKLRAEVAALEVQLAEQRIEFESFRETLLVTNVGVISGARGHSPFKTLPFELVVGRGYRLSDVDPRYEGYENTVVITSIDPSTKNFCWRVR